jgi:transcriptional regulator with XRE-family HTH domain
MGDVPSFGAWLKRRRKALDLTQDGLAQLVGCAVVTIRKLEAEVQPPSRQLAERLAEHLAIPAEQRASFIQFARLGLDAVAPELPLPEEARVPAAPPASTASSSRARKQSNLPAQLTSMIGREREVGEVCALLRRPDVRLVTLTGPGGIGKTRLALQAAAQLLENFDDGIIFVDLASIRDPALVPAAMARELEMADAGPQALEQRLQTYLRDKHMLLLLDNFEQVADAAPLAAALLAAAPQLQLLITSRKILHISVSTSTPCRRWRCPHRRNI